MNRITFINHATVLIELAGTRILTDPVFTLSVSFFLPRLQRPGIPLRELPPIDLVTISHDHYDHMNLRTLRRIARQHSAAILLPKGLGAYGRRTGFRDVHELDWGETTDARGVKTTCVPARHFSGRVPWRRDRSRPSGFVFSSGGTSVYFAGDTASGEHFRKIGEAFRLDAALLPIGAYKPHQWFKDIHLNPRTAIEAFRETRAQLFIPIHWGTFKISDEPMSEPPEWLSREAQAAGVTERVKILRNGESVEIEQRR
jgi:L-ascorbate metabolism protein UlaG (beta-lactamase superfamily)